MVLKQVFYIEGSSDNQARINEKEDGEPLMSDDEGPSMLDTLSSEQLARRPSFKYLLNLQ